MSAIVNPVSDASDLEKAASSAQNNSTSAEPQQTPTPLLPTVAEGVSQGAWCSNHCNYLYNVQTLIYFAYLTGVLRNLLYMLTSLSSMLR